MAKATGRARGLAFDADLGWRPLPNLRKTGDQWGASRPARTNSLGWRDAERTLEKPRAVRRIVALGDSYTFGIGVDDGERYTEALERRFERLEVVNLGVNAYGTDQELRALETWGVRFSPDLVILQVYLENDLEDIRHERRFSWPRPHYLLVGGDLRLVPPRRTGDVVLRTSSYLGEILHRLLDRAIGRDRLAPAWESADPVPLFAALVRRIADVARGEGAPILVLLADAPDRVGPGIPPEREGRARDALAALGLPILDTGPLLAGAEEEAYGAHGHWSPRGHALVAEAIAREIRARDWLRDP